MDIVVDIDRSKRTRTTQFSRFISSLLLIGMMIFAGTGDSVAQSDEAAAIKSMLQQRDAQIKGLLGNKSELSDTEADELRGVVNDVISFKAMGEASLGRHWKKLSETQQSEFVDVFSKIVKAQSLADLNPYRAKIEYGAISVDGNSASATTTGTIKNVSTEIEYKLIKEGSEWKVEDISLDKVSTVKGYARSFQGVVRKKGYDSLMTSLEKKLAKIQ